MYHDNRRRVYELFSPSLGGRIGYYLDWFIMALITVNVVAAMLQTVDAFERRYGFYFYWFEVISVAIFTIEYGARVWSCVENPEYTGPIAGRVRFASRPLLVVDFVAILPFYLTAVGVGLDLRFLRALRLVRLLRLLKLARYSDSLRVFRQVIEREKEKLVLATFANGLLLIIASSAMYFAEHQAQPEVFSSIPAALWWGVVTLTTVGYGNVHPITPLGKLIGGVVSVLGVGLFALPASILAGGFIDQTDSDPTRCPHCGEIIEDG